ncbi:MAG: hypothetical protein DRR42_07915, partial [Gammaproteobacteria bacterium]
ACGKRASNLRPDYVTGKGSSPVEECPENVPVDCNLLLEATPGGRRASQNDAWVLARAGSSLVSMAVEGKVSESFGPTLGEWQPDSSSGKRERYSYLCEQLGLDQSIDETVRYQFLHRTASALIEARRLNASRAIMLVHSFSQVDEGIQDYKKFLSLFGVSGDVNQLVPVGERGGVDLSLCWVRGDKRYLDK